MKRVAISLLTLLALGMLYLAAGDSEPVAEVLTPEVVHEVEAAEPIARDLAVPELDASAESAPEKRTAVVEPAPIDVVAATNKSEPETLQGRVILTDDSGVEHSELDGQITIIRWLKGSGAHVQLEVTDGAFVVEVSGFDRLEVDRLDLGGKNTVLDEQGAEYPVDQSPLVIRAHWAKALRLSVLDSESGTHLSGITVIESDGWGADQQNHPGQLDSDSAAISNGLSPVELVPNSDGTSQADKVFFVHSPGYAWKSVRLDLTNGGQREVRLEQGGDLVIHLTGELPKHLPFFRLREIKAGASGVFMTAAISRDEAIEIPGLPPGKYRASVEVGEWYSDPVVLGELQVVVEPGGKSEYELLVELPPEVVTARFAGTLFLPKEWGISEFELKTEGSEGGGRSYEKTLAASEMEELKGEGGAWAFDFGMLPVGGYELMFESDDLAHEFSYAIRIKLEPGGDEAVQFKIPLPATVRVQVLEDPSGEPASMTSLSWGPLAPGTDRMSSFLTAGGTEEEPGIFEFLAPIGQIMLHTFANGYESMRENLDIQLGLNEFTYRLSRECPLVIVFLDEETPVPVGGDWYPRPEHLDGEGELLYTQYGGQSSFHTALSRPGRYVFKMPTVEGFEAIPDQTITVLSGEETRYVIQLVRKE